jgi:hypothetical protein
MFFPYVSFCLRAQRGMQDLSRFKIVCDLHDNLRSGQILQPFATRRAQHDVAKMRRVHFDLVKDERHFDITRFPKMNNFNP